MLEGIANIYMPNIDSTSIERMLTISNDHASCHAMIGLHPCYVKENYKTELQNHGNKTLMRIPFVR
ncbi:MAG: hypothetical protein IPN46_03650 [Saprospiraceae bacterium]|nr:hypothetical protein [Saprospiraceae bacterium]